MQAPELNGLLTQMIVDNGFIFISCAGCAQPNFQIRAANDLT